jgi:hypothetical protein
MVELLEMVTGTGLVLPIQQEDGMWQMGEIINDRVQWVIVFRPEVELLLLIGRRHDNLLLEQ